MHSSHDAVVYSMLRLLTCIKGSPANAGISMHGCIHPRISSSQCAPQHEHNTRLPCTTLNTPAYNATPQDLFFNFADTPTGCPLDIPWLQYSVLQPPGYKAPEGADVAAVAADYDKHLQDYLREEYVPGYRPDPRRDTHLNGTGYTRGFTIPLAKSWHLALSEEQLRVYTACTQRAAPWDTKATDVFWRGSTTGRSRGWRDSAWQAWKQRVRGRPNYIQQAVMNKRAFLGLLSYPFRPELDVALNHFYHEEIGPVATMDDRMGGHLLQMLIGGNAAPMHEWTKHKFTVSIDGHGPPFRLPEQLLSGTAILMMDTPYRTEFAAAFQPGKHYIPYAYDFRDWLQVALSTVEQARTDSMAFRRMAEAAAYVAANRFCLLGQLDTLMTSIMGVKRHSPWRVRLREGEADFWQPLPPQNATTWGPGGLSAEAKEQICQFNADKQQAWHANKQAFI